MSGSYIIDLGKLVERDRAYHRNTRVTKHRDGRVTIRCGKGLWSVTAPNEKAANREAMHYFVQYYEDGEYHTHE